MISNQLQTLKKLLQALSQAIEPDESAIHFTFQQDSTSLAAEILTIVTTELTSDHHALASSLLFDPKTGVLRILRSSKGISRHDRAKVFIFNTLTAFIPKLGASSILPYAVQIITTCMAIFRSQDSSRVKLASFRPVEQILDLGIPHSTVDLSVDRLFEQYYMTYIQQYTKISLSVKGAILSILGLISKQYPHSIMEDWVEQLQRHLLKTIEKLFSTKRAGIDTQHIVGAMTGLNFYLFQFEFIKQEDLNLVYKCIKFVIHPIDNLTRYDLPKAGLQILINHSEMFADIFLKDWLVLYNCFECMSIHKNRDLSRLGLAAFVQFFKNISKALLQNCEGADEKLCFVSILSKFNYKLTTPNLSVSEVSLAIYGFGMLSHACKFFWGADEFTSLTKVIMQHGVQFYSNVESINEAHLLHIPSFLQAFSHICVEMDTIDSEFVHVVGMIVEVMLVYFPSIGAVVRNQCCKALLTFLWNLYSTHESLFTIWRHCVSRAIAFTLSDGSLQIKTSLLSATGTLKQEAYKEYLLFWNEILNTRSLMLENNIDPKSIEQFIDLMIDEIIHAVIAIPQKLDLSIKDTTMKSPIKHADAEYIFETQRTLQNSQSQLSDNEACAETDTFQIETKVVAVATHPKDHQVLINLVQFCKVFFLGKPKHRLSQWMLVFAETWIKHSRKHPLISGYYNMFTLCLKICIDTDFFSDTDQTRQHALDCKKMFCNYVAHVLRRMWAFKDDLLCSCLSLVLSAPFSILDISKMQDAMQTAFSMGTSYFPMAVVGLDALERWIKNSNVESWQSVLSHVLPSLVEYLSTSPNGTVQNTSNSHFFSKKFKLGMGAIQRDKLDSSLETSTIDHIDLNKIKRRVVLLLGRIGQYNRLLLDGKNFDVAISWNREKPPLLFFDVPYRETIARIYFDDIIPRISYLAEFSPNRKVKVAALELLYSLILLMLGRIAFGLGHVSDTRCKFHDIFEKVFPCILRIAVDVEPISRSLFQPLLLQIIRWLSIPENRKASETAVLFFACMDAATSDSATQRDFGSKSIAEFLFHFLKNPTDDMDEDSKDYSDVSTIFIRIYHLLDHHEPHKRLGACMIVGKIKHILQFNTQAATMFTFEMLYHSLYALRISDRDEVSDETVVSAQKAVESIAYIIVTRVDLFKNVDDLRRLFPGLESSDLLSLIKWLFGQFGSVEYAFAQACRDLFIRFTNLISNKNTMFDSLIYASPNYLTDQLLSPILQGNWRHDSALGRKWIQQLSVSLDSFTFLLKNDLLKPQLVTCQPMLINPLLQFVNVCSRFQTLSDLRNITHGDQSYVDVIALSVVKLFGLMNIVFSLQGSIEMHMTSDIWALVEEPMFKILTLAVFNPAVLGLDLLTDSIPNSFDHTDIGVSIRLESIVESTLDVFYRRLPMENRVKMLLSIASGIDPLALELLNLHECQSFAHYRMQFRGLSLLTRTLWMSELSNIGALHPLQRGLESLVFYSVKTDPGIIEITQNFLSVCLSISTYRSFVCFNLLMFTDLDVSKKAQHFYHWFQPVLDQSFATKFDEYAPFIKEFWASPQVHMVVLGMLDSLLSAPTDHVDAIQLLNKVLPQCIPLLESLFSHRNHEQTGIARLFFNRINSISNDTVMNHPDFLKLMTAELAFLLETRFSLAEKRDTIRHLARFASIDKATENLMTQCIENIIQIQFPVSPNGIKALEGTDQYLQYVAVVENLLQGIEMHGSVLIAKVLFSHLCRDDNSIFTYKIQQGMNHMGTHLSDVKAHEFTDMCMHIMYNLRGNVVKDVLIPVLLGMSEAKLIAFFTKHVKSIMQSITSDVTLIMGDITRDLVIKASCFSLMEVAYLHIPHKELHHISGKVINAYTHPFPAANEKALSLALIKSAHSAKSEDVPILDPVDLAPIRLMYHRAAYGALSAVICKTQFKSEMYRVFLFSENPHKQERHWSNLIDLHQQVSFLCEFSKDVDFQSDKLNFSQTSNNQDVSNFQNGFPLFKRDLLDCVIRSLDGAARISTTALVDVGSMHVCAAQLLETFNQETSFHIRAFIVKVILMHSDYFEKFKTEFWKPLAQMLADETTFFGGFNSLVKEIISQLVLWSTNMDGSKVDLYDDSLESRYIIIKMMRVVCLHCGNQVRFEMLRNVALISHLIQCFSKRIVTPTDIIYDQLQLPKDTATKYDALSALYLCFAFSSNGLPIYSGVDIQTPGLSEGLFYKSIVTQLSSARKDIFIVAAELIGHTLENFKQESHTLLNYVACVVHKELQKTYLGEARDIDKFVVILNRISLKYPPILTDFGQSLLFILPQLFGSTKALCLETLVSCASSIPSMFIELCARDLLGLLSHRDDECQKFTLLILIELIPDLSVDDMEYFLKTIVPTFSTHPDQKCRQAYFLLILVIIQKLSSSIQENDSFLPDFHRTKKIRRDLVSEQTTAKTLTFRVADLLNHLHMCLLQGLDDTCDDICSEIANYVEKNIIGKVNLFDRTSILFESLYSSDTENSFVSYATRFLLGPSQHSAGYDTDLFSKSLKDGYFVDMPIDTSWINNTTIQPLFLSQENSDDLMDKVTEAYGVDSTTKSDDDTHWLFIQDTNSRRQFFSSSNFQMNSLFLHKLNQVKSTIDCQSTRAALKSLKRKHEERTVAEERAYFSKETACLKQNLIKAESLRKLAQNRKVKILCNYRTGKYPDVQIKCSSIIKPLEQLVQSDHEVSRFVFSKLVTSIWTTSDRKKSLPRTPSNQMQSTDVVKKDLQSVVSKLLIRSKFTSATFVGTMLRILYETPCTHIDPLLIVSASIKTGNENLGIMILEKSIQKNVAKKSIWTGIATLYRSIGDLSVYHGVYEAHFDFTKNTQDALYFSSISDYNAAKNIYETALSGPFDRISAEEVSVWKQGVLECYSKLFEWENIQEFILKDSGNPIKSIDTEAQPTYIHQFIRSWLHLCALQGFACETERIFSPTTELQQDYLELHHSFELGLVSILKDDYDQAWHYVNSSFSRFSDCFSALGMYSKLGKLKLLSSLQMITEVYDALTRLRDNSQFEILKQWSSRFPNPEDDIDIWGDLLLSREIVMSRWPKTGDKDTESIQIAVEKSHREMIRHAYNQQNFQLATLSISRMMPQTMSFHAPSILDGFLLNAARLNSVHISSFDKADIFCNLFANAHHYQKQILSLDDPVKTEFIIAESRCIWSILKQVVNHADIVGPRLLGNKKLLRVLAEKCNTFPENTASLGSLLNMLAFDGLNTAKQIMDQNLRRQATVAIAEQCDQVLRWIEAQDPNVLNWSVSKYEYAFLVIRLVISSMMYGNRSSRELFPRLLQLVELFPDTKKEFAVLCDGLAPWMLLRWISQLTAVLDKPYGDAVFLLLQRLSSIFPSAIVFPLQISATQYLFTAASTVTMEKVNGLLSFVSSPLTTTFIQELRRLTEPAHIFKDWMDHTELILNLKAEKRQTQLQSAFLEMKEYCIESHSNSCTGAKEFSKKHSIRILEICGLNGEQFLLKRTETWREIKLYYTQFIHGKEHFPQGSTQLKYYSPWLAMYGLDHYLEEGLMMPGQLERADGPVLTSNCTKILFFQTSILALGSLRRPKRLTCVGSNGKEYPFLVKGGDDLRLDQRVEHMFAMLNSILTSNPRSKKLDLSIRVYSVVPMTRTLGMLEWVNNTKPLRECMSDVTGFQTAFANADKQYSQFIESYRNGTKTIGELYGNVLMYANADDVAHMIQSLWMIMEKPFLKLFIQNLAASAEAYILIRSGFAKSWASLSIASYIMGIGDRHTENFLVDLKSGHVIGIDFGYAFGSATEVLPVPELVPFRLTRQIKEFMGPLGIHVLLEPPMVDVMTVLQEKKDMIMTSLDIFVKEPLMEWRKFAISQYKRNINRFGALTESSDIDTNSLNTPKWYPQQKLDVAARKLCGEHPSYIQLTELLWGHTDKPYLGRARDILVGNDTLAMRSQVGQQCADVREQVRCLIDQATDPNILGRAWRGWLPFC
ncbi:hypothetical protein BDV3_001782 [Batrachochytrium dendrobatidis]